MICSKFSVEKEVIMRKFGASLVLINLLQDKIFRKENQKEHDVEMYKPLI